VALHYGGEVTPFYGKGFLARLVEPGLQKLGAILVAPDCRHEGWANPESETDVMALLGHILANLAIDRRRILVTGFSMGGRGSWYMAARHPEMFSAAIVVAGSPPEGTVDKLDKMPLYVIHSRDDEVVPIGPTKEAVKTLESRGAPVELFVVYRLPHFQVPGYVRHLQRAAKWLEKKWEE
jgi:predicted peptidase